MIENVKIELLQNIQLFSSLTENELQDVAGKIRIEEFRKNEIVMREEDTNEFMYIILAGQVKVIQATEDGKEILLAIHKTHEFFGEVSLIDGKTSPATVQASEDSFIAIISRKDFHSLISAQGKVLDALLQILCGRLRDSWRRIYLLNFKHASDRVKTLFFSLSFENGSKTPDGIVLNLKLTHQEIADMTGLTRESVTRVLDKLQKDGAITVLKNRQICLSHKFIKSSSAAEQ
ncbi:MAG: fnr-2 [Nitrospirae bacterium]|jgi:CRP/FNR family transcriptional regulator|nr:fnr-2 [Nitrospirota bacterium]MBS1232913.1 fnr-2 [Nitrospirota bacterium]